MSGLRHFKRSVIKINNIIVKNVPLSSVLFTGGSAVANNITLGTIEKEFDTPTSGQIEGVMYLFESSSPFVHPSWNLRWSAH